jgi:hypothetical protein
LVLHDLPPKRHGDASAAGDGDATTGMQKDAGGDGDAQPSHMNDGAAGDGDKTGDGDGDGDGTGGHDAGGHGGDGDTMDAGHDAGHVVDPHACDGGPERTFYRDTDDDKHGDPAVKMVACTSPGALWVEDVHDDCEPTLHDVHLDQADFFPVGYHPASDPGSLSFDYDCDGMELAGPGQDQAPAACGGLLVCAGSGYAKNDQRANLPNVNPYCGSNVITSCVSAVTCQASSSTTSDRFVCN